MIIQHFWPFFKPLDPDLDSESGSRRPPESGSGSGSETLSKMARKWIMGWCPKIVNNVRPYRDLHPVLYSNKASRCGWWQQDDHYPMFCLEVHEAMQNYTTVQVSSKYCIWHNRRHMHQLHMTGYVKKWCDTIRHMNKSHDPTCRTRFQLITWHSMLHRRLYFLFDSSPQGWEPRGIRKGGGKHNSIKLAHFGT